VDEEVTSAITTAFAANVGLRRRHAPQPYPGDVVFFEATLDKPADMPRPVTWTPYLQGTFEHHEVACTHGGMSRPEPLAAIAAVLATRLESPRRTR
jgi:thioesterase domain-containing protein